MHREKILKINDMISKIKDKNILKEIFLIVQPELQDAMECKYSHNDNGVFFDLRLLTDITLDKIDEVLRMNVSTDTETLNYSIYCSDDDSSSAVGPKLNNVEKNIIIKTQKNT